MAKQREGYGPAFRFSRFVLRRIFRFKKYPVASEIPIDAVLVCHHRNLRGPVRALAYLPGQLRMWSYYVFCEQKTCFRQLYGYTLTERRRWPRAIAFVYGGLLSYCSPLFMRSFGAIPVYRGGAEALRTIRESVDALEKGDSLLVFPDIDYTSDDARIGEIYRGFLLVDRAFFKKTGRHVNFVPVCVREDQRAITLGRTVRFGDGFGAEEVALALREEINRLTVL